MDVDGSAKVCDIAAHRSHIRRAKLLFAVFVALVLAGVLAALPPYPPF